MVKIYIDGKKYLVNSSNNLLQTCLTLGLNIPYFCWHPKLGSIGACRQCAVTKYQNDKDTQGRIVMSCMTPVEDQSIFTINDETSQIFRKNIIELLMLNHPHDCPICDEGGNCHLQDMTVMSKHVSRRYRFRKKIYKNQYLGFFISHHMNRCISCYRCVRYYKDYAGGKDFDVYGANSNLYFGRSKDGELESEYSGNLIEVCPTGVFTDKNYSENYSRKWDMQHSPSICAHCSIGCNIIVGARYNEIRRIENRYHENINNYFLCDLGRFGYNYSNSLNRPKKCYLRKNNVLQESCLDITLRKVVKIIQKSSLILGIGSSRASVETNFSLKKLVGKDNFSTGMIDIDQKCSSLILNILKNSSIHIPSLQEVEEYDAILVLGEDVTQTASRLALSIRQAIQKKTKNSLKKNNLNEWDAFAVNNIQENKKKFLFTTNIDDTKLDDIADFSYKANVQDQFYFGYCLYKNLKKKFSYADNLTKDLREKSLYIVKKLLNAKKILIISGSHSRNISLIKVAYNIAYVLKNLNLEVGLILLSPTSNSMGLSIINGISLSNIFQKIKKHKSATLIVVENDLFCSYPSVYITKFLKKFKNIIVLDHQFTQMKKFANIFLPSANFFESSGTVINYELRAQRFFQAYDVNFYDRNISIMPSWKFLNLIMSQLFNENFEKKNLDDCLSDCISYIPFLKKIKDASPNSLFRIFGQKISRLSHRFSGKTSLRADINVHEIPPKNDKDTMFSFSMEDNTVYNKRSSCVPFIWSPNWNSSNGWHKYQKEVSGSLLAGNPGKILLSKRNKEDIDYFKFHPKHFVQKKGLIIVPYYLLFGSEELSQYSDVVKKKMSNPVLKINKLDAKRLNLSNRKKVFFTYLGEIYKFFLIYSQNLSVGQIAIPVGQNKTSIFLLGKEIQDLKEL
ncbi:NADH-quinone oxidoreductase subunit NuoG [Buchnera aphidicola]|uniref:NADH-quinone oxidoreductase subunit NuoG n=1 Tax=Buchnera aphidicola TaxID=9 RepID=UPI002542C59F|nr:NADH-quinone oxidoreductase subunit NuoG [Buchnera aphidicola]WII23790.1 NADH-quinone oxidoreductase subunit NuoG [Buchnera aphidicola (Sipha maydis)]